MEDHYFDVFMNPVDNTSHESNFNATSVSPDARASTSTQGVPDAATFHELWEIALVLEPLAAQLAGGHASDADLEELAANLAATELLLRPEAGPDRDFGKLVALDVAFHKIIARASGNRALMRARDPVNLLYNPAMSLLQTRLPQAHSRNCVAHRHIFEGLRRQDSAHAETWMRKHLVDYQRGYVIARLDMDVAISLKQ